MSWIHRIELREKFVWRCEQHIKQLTLSLHGLSNRSEVFLSRMVLCNLRNNTTNPLTTTGRQSKHVMKLVILKMSHPSTSNIYTGFRLPHKYVPTVILIEWEISSLTPLLAAWPFLKSHMIDNCRKLVLLQYSQPKPTWIQYLKQTILLQKHVKSGRLRSTGCMQLYATCDKALLRRFTLHQSTSPHGKEERLVLTFPNFFPIYNFDQFCLSAISQPLAFFLIFSSTPVVISWLLTRTSSDVTMQWSMRSEDRWGNVLCITAQLHHIIQVRVFIQSSVVEVPQA